MEKKEKNFGYTAVVTLQLILVLAGMLNTIYQIFFVEGKAEFNSAYVLLVVYVCIVVYAVWGYKKSAIPFNLAITFVLMENIIAVTRVVDKNEVKYPTVIISGLIGLTIIVFMNSFRKHSKIALVSGFIMVVLALVMAIIALVAFKQQELSITEIMQKQVFGQFICLSAIYATYGARYKWKKDGMRDIFFI